MAKGTVDLQFVAANANQVNNAFTQLQTQYKNMQQQVNQAIAQGKQLNMQQIQQYNHLATAIGNATAAQQKFNQQTGQGFNTFVNTINRATASLTRMQGQLGTGFGGAAGGGPGGFLFGGLPGVGRMWPGAAGGWGGGYGAAIGSIGFLGGGYGARGGLSRTLLSFLGGLSGSMTPFASLIAGGGIAGTGYMLGRSYSEQRERAMSLLDMDRAIRSNYTYGLGTPQQMRESVYRQMLSTGFGASAIGAANYEVLGKLAYASPQRIKNIQNVGLGIATTFGVSPESAAPAAANFSNLFPNMSAKQISNLLATLMQKSGFTPEAITSYSSNVLSAAAAQPGMDKIQALAVPIARSFYGGSPERIFTGSATLIHRIQQMLEEGVIKYVKDISTGITRAPHPVEALLQIGGLQGEVRQKALKIIGTEAQYVAGPLLQHPEALQRTLQSLYGPISPNAPDIRGELQANIMSDPRSRALRALESARSMTVGRELPSSGMSMEAIRNISGIEYATEAWRRNHPYLNYLMPWTANIGGPVTYGTANIGIGGRPQENLILEAAANASTPAEAAAIRESMFYNRSHEGTVGFDQIRNVKYDPSGIFMPPYAVRHQDVTEEDVQDAIRVNKFYRERVGVPRRRGIAGGIASAIAGSSGSISLESQEESWTSPRSYASIDTMNKFFGAIGSAANTIKGGIDYISNRRFRERLDEARKIAARKDPYWGTDVRSIAERLARGNVDTSRMLSLGVDPNKYKDTTLAEFAKARGRLGEDVTTSINRANYDLGLKTGMGTLDIGDLINYNRGMEDLQREYYRRSQDISEREAEHRTRLTERAERDYRQAWEDSPYGRLQKMSYDRSMTKWVEEQVMRQEVANAGGEQAFINRQRAIRGAKTAEDIQRLYNQGAISYGEYLEKMSSIEGEVNQQIASANIVVTNANVMQVGEIKKYQSLEQSSTGDPRYYVTGAPPSTGLQ